MMLGTGRQIHLSNGNEDLKLNLNDMIRSFQSLNNVMTAVWRAEPRHDSGGGSTRPGTVLHLEQSRVK